MASMEKMNDYTDLANSLGNGLITASLQRRQQLLLLRQYYCNDYLHFVAVVVFAASAPLSRSLSRSLALSNTLSSQLRSRSVCGGKGGDVAAAAAVLLPHSAVSLSLCLEVVFLLLLP